MSEVNGPLLVLFYVNWCGFCKKIKPTWESLGNSARKNPNNKVSVVQVDCDNHKRLAIQHGIKSFPTIKYLPNGISSTKGSEKYENESKRDIVSLTAYLNELNNRN